MNKLTHLKRFNESEENLNISDVSDSENSTIMNVETAVKILTEAIKKDEGLRESYKANIAMAFKDEYARKRKEKNNINYSDIHEIANNAADDFLELWCK